MKKYLLLILMFLWASPAFAAYSYYRTTTIDHTKVPNTDQASFPILVCANGSSPCNTSVAGLNQSGGGAHVQNSNGYDIGFFTDSGCTTKVTAWEVEKYVASTGELEAWVNDGTLSHTADTVIYMCYGDSGISTFQSTATAVWDSHFKGVWHLNDLPGDTHVNSVTGNSCRADHFRETATTYIGTALDDTSAAPYCASDGASGSETITRPGNTDINISAWFYRSTTAAASAGAMSLWQTSGASSVFIPYFADNNFYWDDYGSGNGRISTSYASYLDSWTYVVFNSKGDNSFGSINLNGVQKVTRSVGQVDSSSQVGFVFFYNSTPGAKYDEVRMSDTVRSTDWISTEYNNMNSPSTFETYGAEGAPGGGGTTFIGHALFVFMKGTFSLTKGLFILN